MARNRRYNDKEYDLLQKLKHENDRLKKQVSSLRKQLQRVDLERYHNLKDLIDKHYEEDAAEEWKAEKKKLEKKWECHDCRVGFMKIFTISRRDGMFYYRKCTECSNRTPTKPYTNKVEGIKDDE